MKSQTIKIAILSLALICLSVFLSTHVTATDKDYCQACGKEVSWQLLTEAAADATTLTEGHYRLSFAGGSCDWQEKTISGKVCIDANGMTVRGVHRIFQVSANGELSLQGEGLWIGGGFAADIANGDRTGALAIVHKGGKMNLYRGTLQTELYTPENVYGFNGGTLFVQGQFRMYGGKLEKGSAANAGGNMFIQTGGEVWMYDGVITGGYKEDVYCKGNLYLEGNASPGVLRLVNPNLTISGPYTGYVLIIPTEKAEGALVGAGINAQLLNPVAISGSGQYVVVVKDDQLVISKEQQDSSETMVSQYCQACGKEVSWQVLTETSANASTLAAGHYKLSFASGSCDWKEKTISGKVCIDANGMTVRGIHRVFQVASNGELSLQGEGLWIGGGFAPETTNTERIGAVGMVQKGGKLNLYSGTLRTALYAPENVYSYNGGALWVQGQLHMYGGRVEKGTATNAGGNVFIQTDGEMRMHDGVLTGGDKRDLYCKGSLYLEGKASPGVSHLTKPELTISGLYTGYLVVSAPELTDGMVLGVSENAQLRYGNISVSHSENRLFLIEKDGQLILSQYQPDHPETIESRYCQACGRYADFVELTEYSGFMGAIRTGHYYLNFPQGSAEYEGMTLVLKDRVCLDLNGMTVYYPSNGFDAQTGCIINVMDSVGGGALRRLENATDTPMVILAEAAELNLYSGSLIGAGNGDRFVSAPNGKIGLYGGEVKNGQLVCGEGTLEIGNHFSGRIAVTCDELLEGMPLGFGKGTCEILLPEDMRGEILRNGQMIAVAKDAAALLCRQDGSVKSFQDFTGAAEAFSADDEKILLLGDVAERVSLSKDLRVDLNGYHITGEICGDGTLYCMDSATADYTIADGIYGSVTVAENVQPVTVGMAGSEDTYLMIDQQGKLSFHRITVKIQSMSLRPEDTGVYFTGNFSGDALVQQQVDRFGVMVSVEEDPVQTDNAVCRTVFLSEDFNGAATSSLVYGIMRKDLPTEENRERAATAVFARPYVRLADGKELIGDCVSRSLQQQMELACEQWNGFGIRQKQVLWDFYHTYKTEMYSSWNVTKMKNLDKRQTKIDAVDYTPYLIPWQKDAVAEAKADGKIHYYFMSGEGLIITEPDKTRWGDACLAVLPNGMTVLIDSGPEAYAPVLLRNLQRLGITKLDAIIISHPHHDHQNGVFSERAILHTGLLDKIPVGKIYWRGGFDPARPDDLLTPDAAAAYGIACEVLERGDVVYFGDIRLEVLWPMAGDGDSVVSNDLEINNFSVVFRWDYGEHSALFTGDMYVKGVSGEMMLLNRTDHSLLDADLMKAPHHGYESSSSASLIRAVSPEIAVAMGDHPIPESVFATYQEMGCNLLGDHYRGYVHIAAGADGLMTSETSRTAAIS